MAGSSTWSADDSDRHPRSASRREIASVRRVDRKRRPGRSRSAARHRVARGRALHRADPRSRTTVALPARRAGRRGPRGVRRVRPVPAALPDLPRDRRGVGLTPRTHHRDAFGRGGPLRTRRDLRAVHGSVPRVSRVRGRVPVARPVRPDDGTRTGPDRTAALATRPTAPMARARGRAAEEEAALARGGPAADRTRLPPSARARPRPPSFRAVPAAPEGHRARRSQRAGPSPC